MDNDDQQHNLGTHLAHRLVELGCTTAFAVPGDFNLLLLDQLLKEPKLNMTWCCNELNAGYAADGYARKQGIGCCVVTYCVGSFSVLNAIAGCFSEDLPVIIISGGPNSNDFGGNRVLHHTTGSKTDRGHSERAFREATCCQVVISHIEDAAEQIDLAISEAVKSRKPAYIEVCCNLANLHHPSFTGLPVPYAIQTRATNRNSLEAALAATLEVLNGAVKPQLLGGVQLKAWGARSAFQKLADASKYPVAIMPDAKGLFPETHERFLGIYWGAVSWPMVCEVVEASDIVIAAGCVWTDYTTTGYSLLVKKEKMITLEPYRVNIKGGKTFGCVRMDDFLEALAQRIKPNDTGFVNFQRMYMPPQRPLYLGDEHPLRTMILFDQLQDFIDGNTAIIAETGDSWFNSQKLRLPEGAGYEIQMRYGSIGWSVGAVLGYSLAARGQKRVIGLIGDGSFQLTAQEVGTMMRYNSNAVIFLINNAGYTIEVEIHDGPYNVIKNWDYIGVVKAFHNGEGSLYTHKVKTEGDLKAALQGIREHPDSLCFIEVVVHRDDCSTELLQWGSRVAAANSRPPVPR